MSAPHIYYQRHELSTYYPDGYSLTYVKGLRVLTDTGSGVYGESYTLDFSDRFVGVALACSTYYDGDYWYVSGSTGKTWCDEIYVKGVSQTVKFDIPSVLASGSTIYFSIYQTGSVANKIYVDLKFYRN